MPLSVTVEVNQDTLNSKSTMTSTCNFRGSSKYEASGEDVCTYSGALFLYTQFKWTSPYTQDIIA